MREILFRGKSDLLGWVEGWYCPEVKWGEHNFPVGITHKTKEGWLDDVVVIPETIGQFTGLTDKNGTKIFEGDVVKAVIVRDLGGGTQNREEAGIIGYDKIGMIGLIAKYAGTIPVWSDFFQELTLSGCIDDFWFEVIGNIHDNPELLENT